MKNRLKERLLKGETCVGTWITIGDADIVALLRNFEFDCFVFDVEHAPLDWGTVAHLVQLLDLDKTTPLVRVALNDEVSIKKSLDLGSQGVIVPFVNSAGDATSAVRYSMYPPRGSRGLGPRYAADFGASSAEYLRTANEQLLTFAIVESVRGIQNFEEIVRVEGLDGVLFGYADLALSYGLVDDYSDSKILLAKKRLVELCHHHGKTPAIYAPTAEDAKVAVGMGFKLIWLGSDVAYLLGGVKSFLGAARSK